VTDLPDNRPDPLIQPDVDLSVYPKFPLDFRKLFSSDTWTLGTPDEKLAAFHLWCESWHQKPAGSLPLDERILAKLSGEPTKWKRVRNHAMRGWIECKDGRLYHPVVVELARDAWDKLLVNRQRGLAGALKKHGRTTSPTTQDLWSEAGNRSKENVREGEAGEPFALPDWLPAENWSAFEQMRTRIKKPLTEFAKKLVVKELIKLQAAGQDPVACLDQSTRCCWQDVYAVKDSAARSGGAAGKQSALESRNADAVERFAAGGGKR
jgi:hypothetical protein